MNPYGRRVLSDCVGLLVSAVIAWAALGTFAPALFLLLSAAFSAGLAFRDRKTEVSTFSSRASNRIEAAIGAAIVCWFVRFDAMAMGATLVVWVAHAALPDKIRNLEWSLPLVSWYERTRDAVYSAMQRLPRILFDAAAVALVAWVFHRIALRFWPTGETPPSFWVTAALFCVLPTLAGRVLSASAGSRRGDSIRIATVMAAAFYLLLPFAQRCLHGTGDAAWYGTMMQDMILQVRAGIFPVFGGQTEFQYSGVLYPIRIAPAFHYLGALTDFGSGRELDGISVQNLMIVLWGMVAAVTSYVSFALLLRQQRFITWAAALLFIACPGTLAVAYFTDLYMSWTTVPFIPVVFAATALTFEKLTFRRTLVLGVALGFLWWGHTPIALWCTLLASALQLVRLFGKWKDLAGEWKPLLCGAVSFGAAASFPIAAAVLFPAEPGAPVASFQRATADAIVHFLKEAWPANLLPIENGGRSLAGFQLGYSLWAVLACCAFLAWKDRTRVALGLTVIGVCLAIWLTPIPGVANLLWSLVPDFVRNTTGNWVMNRLYVIFAAVVLVALGCVAPRWCEKATKIQRALLVTALLGLVGWSLSEGRKFGAFSEANQRPAEEALRNIAPENIVITRFAYLVFPQIPGTFTHGTTDPELEHRFLSDAGDVLWTNESRIVDAATRGDEGTSVRALEKFSPTTQEDRWSIKSKLELAPGARHLLQFNFGAPTDREGILQLKGRQLFREYGMPVYGGPLSFGSSAGAKNTVPIWTTLPSGDAIEIAYYQRGTTTDGDIARLSVRDISFTQPILPIRVKSWLPYRVEVDTPDAGWVETPRAFQAHWKRSDGGPLKKTQEGLLAFKHEGGKHTYEITYRVPTGFYVIFWASAATLIAGLVVAPATRIRFSV